jgi:hypothetical protein
MKIQIVSDIHLGLAPCALPNVGADLLILAGDIHRPVEALRWARELPIPIIYVPGNHEYYGSSLPATDRLLRELVQDSNVTLLDCAEKRIGDLRVLGATLWTDFLLYGEGPEREKAMDEAKRFSRDFSRITVDEEGLETLSPEHCATLFMQHANWLDARLAEPFDGRNGRRDPLCAFGRQCRSAFCRIAPERLFRLEPGCAGREEWRRAVGARPHPRQLRLPHQTHASARQPARLRERRQG